MKTTNQTIKKEILLFLISVLFAIPLHAQENAPGSATPGAATAPAPATTKSELPKAESKNADAKNEAQEIPELADENNSGKISETDERFRGTSQGRIRQYFNFTLGVDQDEKIELPEKDYAKKGTGLEFVDVRYSKELNMFRFIPKKEGFGIITLHDKKNGAMLAEFRVEVRKTDLEKIVREVKALLTEVEGISIKIVNNKVLVDGQVILPKDLFRIAAVIKQFENKVVSIATLSPFARKKIAEFIARDINNPEVTVRSVNNFIILEGVVENQKEIEKILELTSMYLPEVVEQDLSLEGLKISRAKLNTGGNDPTKAYLSVGIINRLVAKPAPQAPPPKMIQVVLHYVELTKTYGNSFNFQFTPALEGEKTEVKFGSDAPSGGASFAATISNLLPKLNWAKAHGHARLLESASLLVKDGGNGSVTKSKQVFVLKTTSTSQSEEPRQANITFNIKPRIVGEKSGSVDLEIAANVADFDARGGVLSSNVQTQVMVRDRQSAAIGGLIRNASTTSYNDPDGAPANPILSLRAAKKYNKDQGQFVVFVTPIIKSSANAGVEQVKKKFRLRD